MFYLPDNLPCGGVILIADELDISPGSVSAWKKCGIPRARREQVESIIKDMGDGLPYGAITAIADYLNRPVNTVHNWFKYGTSKENRKELNKAMEVLGYG